MILCVGTTPAIQRTMLFDRLTLDSVNRATTTLDTGGGKSINAARVLHTLGQAPLATGFLGGDTGQFIRREFDSLAIRHDFVTVPHPTRICVTVLDRAAHTATELVEETPPVEDSLWPALLNKIEQHMPQADALILSGSLPPKAPDDFYARCMRFAASPPRVKPIPTILDARGPALRLALPFRPTLVKPNRSELASMFNQTLDTDESLRQAMRDLISLGAQWVLITMGKDGALLTDGQRFWRLPIVPVPALNPIGSGDSFAAGLTTSLLQGQPLPDASRLGVACAAANALTLPAGHIEMDQVHRLLPQVRIEPI